MRILGIDPGLSGALAVYDGANVSVLPVPTVKAKTRGRQLNEPLLFAAVDMMNVNRIDHCFLEDVNPMPREGVSSAFKFGYVKGVLRGLVASYSIPLTLVRPNVWKRELSVGAAKDAAIARACDLMPLNTECFTPLRGHLTKRECEGTAEAALIAYYGYRKAGGL